MKEPPLRRFLFPPNTDCWVTILRIGLGLQVTLFAWSLRTDWSDLFGTERHGLVNRRLTEVILSSQSPLTPRLGWLLAGGHHLGMSAATSLSLIWWVIVVAGLCLLAGLFCRLAAISGWFLYLSCVKSGLLFTYGVDNFTTIGLFYLMIAPLPDACSLDQKLWGRRRLNPERLGFHRRVLQFHLCVIYFFGGFSKSLGAGWWNGDSIWRALTRPPFDAVPAEVLLRYAAFLPAIGILVCLLEMGYAIFIWPKRTRPFWLAGVVLMHLSIGLTMGLYLFALIMIVLNFAGFGPEYLTWTQRALRSQRRQGDDSAVSETMHLEESG